MRKIKLYFCDGLTESYTCDDVSRIGNRYYLFRYGDPVLTFKTSSISKIEDENGDIIYLPVNRNPGFRVVNVY